MPTLLFAIGNTLRRDDGAALEAVRQLGPQPQVEVRVVHQLTPECALDLHASGAELVVFVDASVVTDSPVLERVPTAAKRPALGHHLPPATLVALARTLYGWTGQAWQCHIPAHDFGHGEGLSPDTMRCAGEAAELVRNLLAEHRGHTKAS